MTTVPEIIASQQSVANDYILQADGFINRVANLANTGYILADLQIPSSPNFGATDATADALDKIITNRPTRPADFGAIAALAPSAPAISFADIDQTLLDQVSAKLHDDLANGGYGIEPNDEAALWQRERDREAQNALAEVDEVTRAFAEGGFSMPPGAMFAARDRALQNAANKISSVNRDIALRRSELYFNARRFTIEQARGVEQMLVELHRAVTEQANVMTALYNSQISKYHADIQAGIELIRGNVAVYSADISAFSATIGAIAEAYRLKTTEISLNNAWNIDVTRAKLEKMQLDLRASVAALGVRTSAAEFGAGYYANTIAAALNSISTLAAQTSTA